MSTSASLKGVQVKVWKRTAVEERPGWSTCHSIGLQLSHVAGADGTSVDRLAWCFREHVLDDRLDVFYSIHMTI